MDTPSWAQPSDLAALREQAEQCLAADRAAVIVEVACTKGSAPRETGARMLITASSESGTIGGGHLEYCAIATAREYLAERGEQTFERQFALGPSLGQCCGGAVALRFMRLSSEALANWPMLPTVDLPPWPAPRSCIAPLHVQLHGAGHVGRAIVASLARLPFTVQWVDEREDAFPSDPGWFAAHPRIHRLPTDCATTEVATAPAGSAFLVLTHNHDLDLRIVEAILQRDDFAFCGLIGSKTKRERFKHRLAERGVPLQTLARLTCPIGVVQPDRLHSKWPETIAARVALQLIERATEKTTCPV